MSGKSITEQYRLVTEFRERFCFNRAFDCLVGYWPSDKQGTPIYYPASTILRWITLNYVPRKEALEVCICSAIKTVEGRVIRGERHGDCFGAIRDRKLTPEPSEEAQGFITSKGRFVTREEGRKLQDAAGIASVDPEGYRGSTLFSEDLY